MPLPQPATIIQLSTTSSSQRHQDAEAEVLLPTASHDSSSPTRRQAAGHPSATRHAVQTDSQATAAAGWQAGHHLHTSQPGTSGDTRAKLCLCGAHALARWGWRTWEFAVVR
jgi:hypothetical protein